MSQTSQGTSVEDWLRDLSREHSLSRAAHAVIQAVIADPEKASYAAISELAAAAGVNDATVTRAARSAGFAGWPAFKNELRARFLGGLTLPAMSRVRRARATGHPFDDALQHHLESLSAIQRALDRRAVRTMAQAIASAQRRYVFASGSYAGLGRILAHNAGVAGYRVELVDEPVAISSAIADLTSQDLVICFNYWRLLKSSFVAAQRARARGATVCVITDQASSTLAGLADHLLTASIEGASVFASLVPSLAIVDGLLAELATIDPGRTKARFAAAEAEWQAFDVFQHPGDARSNNTMLTPDVRQSPRRRPRKPPADRA